MAWRRPGDKPLSEPMMFSLLTDIYATPPQWDNRSHRMICFSMSKHEFCYDTVSPIADEISRLPYDDFIKWEHFPRQRWIPKTMEWIWLHESKRDLTAFYLW